jgi:hypothetical protein
MFPHNGNTRFIIPRAGARPLPPVITPSGGSVASGTQVTITSSEGLPCYYVTDASLPGEYFLYVSPIAIVGPTVIRAVAKRPGGLPSAVVSAQFTLGTDPNFIRWEFDNTLDGWTVPVGTPVLGPTYLAASAPASPVTYNRVVATSGQTGLIWQYLEVNYRQVSETSSNSFNEVRWANTNHGYSTSYRKQGNRAGNVNGNTYSVVYDMWASSSVADWQNSDVLQIAWKSSSDTTGTSGCSYEVNWIEARKAGFP